MYFLTQANILPSVPLSGAYIRTSDGRIFAIRAANKVKGAEDLAPSPGEGRSLNGGTAEVPPVSPDGQDIISELQRYAVGLGLSAHEQAVGTTRPQEMAPNSGSSASTNLASTKEVKSNNNNNSVIATAKVSMLNNHSNASLANAQPSMDASTGQDLRTSSKRKTTTPPPDKPASQLPVPDKHSSASLASHGFPISGGYGIPPLGLNPALLSGSMGNPFLMGTNSLFPPPYFQHLLEQTGEPCMMYPEMFGLGGAGAVPRSSALSASSSDSVVVCATSSLSSSRSVEPATSAASALPRFMMNPSMAGMAGLLPPGYPLCYTQSLASLYPGAMHPDGLPGSAATPGPAGSSFLSKYPPSSTSSSSSSSPCPSSPSAHFSSRRGTVLVKNGGVLSATGSAEDDDDNDVIEVIGQ